MAARKKTKSKAGYDLIVAHLKRNPKAEYATIRSAAEKAGHTIYPVMFGRAKAALGLVKMSARGAGKAKRAMASPVRRGPGRPPKVAANGSAFESVIQSMREQEAANSRISATLQKIRALIDDVL